jgi:hypothetical protein
VTDPIEPAVAVHVQELVVAFRPLAYRIDQVRADEVAEPHSERAFDSPLHRRERESKAGVEMDLPVRPRERERRAEPGDVGADEIRQAVAVHVVEAMEQEAAIEVGRAAADGARWRGETNRCSHEPPARVSIDVPVGIACRIDSCIDEVRTSVSVDIDDVAANGLAVDVRAADPIAVRRPTSRSELEAVAVVAVDAPGVGPALAFAGIDEIGKAVAGEIEHVGRDVVAAVDLADATCGDRPGP